MLIKNIEIEDVSKIHYKLFISYLLDCQLKSSYINTILKMKNIMDKMNSKNNPRSNLLLSLKPYLKESRRSKIDQYIQLLNMGNVMEAFGNTGGGKQK